MKNFASKVCIKNQKEVEGDPRLTKYEMTDFMLHDEVLYQEFKEMLARDHIVTHIAVNEELNKFLTQKVEGIMMQKKRENRLESDKKVISVQSADATVECSSDDERTNSLRQRRYSCDASMASCANDSVTSKHASWEGLFQKMKRRTSLNDSVDINNNMFEGNHTVTGISMTRSLSEDCETANIPQTRRNSMFRDDSFLCKLTVANIPLSIEAEQKDVDKKNNSWYDFEEHDKKITNDRYVINDDEPSAVFNKMRRRLSGSS